MIELTTGALLLFSSFYGTVEGSTTARTTPVTKSVVAEEETFDKLHVTNPVTLEEHVRTYFKEAPILAEIAFCESSFRHFDSKGQVIRGEVNSDDVGIMQINEYYHKDTADKLGIDIYTLDGNMAYAKWLYGKYGDKPWVYSSKCWNSKKLALAK